MEVSRPLDRWRIESFDGPCVPRRIEANGKSITAGMALTTRRRRVDLVTDRVEKRLELLFWLLSEICVAVVGSRQQVKTPRRQKGLAIRARSHALRARGSNRLQVVLITGRSPHILGWGATLSRQTTRICCFRIRQDDGFQLQVVPPAIAEIVQVLKAGSSDSFKSMTSSRI